MAYGSSTNPGGGESPKDNYFDDGEMKEQEGDPTEFEAPIAAFAGKQDEFHPGDEVIFKVVRKNENSVTLAYAYGDEEEKGEHEEGESEVQPPESMKQESMMD